MATYTSYTKTRYGLHSQYGTVHAGQRVAVKIIASMWQNDHGKFWAAYCGDGEKSNDEIADHGTKLDRELAERLFPQVVAAGFGWWD